MNVKRLSYILFVLFFSSSCVLEENDPIETTDDEVNVMQSGDIVVVNTANDAVILLDQYGVYKATIYSVPTNAAISFPALAWDGLRNRLLIAYDHTTNTLDKIITVSKFNLSNSTELSNSNLAGTLPGLARLTGGDMIILEGTTTAEKYDSSGVRVGAPLSAALVVNNVDAFPLQDGGFGVCATGTAANTVRLYDSSAVAGNGATSVAPAPSLGAAIAASGCAQGPSGRIAVAFNGVTDGVRLYSSDLTTLIWNFIDTNVLTTPTKVAFRSNGNVLVPDSAFNHIVEISSGGALVGTLGIGYLATPGSILVVP